MIKILIYLALASAFIYLFLSVGRFFSGRKSVSSSREKLDFGLFWGFAFAILFYYGFPLWWWRYGIRKALELVFVCFGAILVVQAVLRELEIIEAGDMLAMGLLISVPIRAIGGVWVARKDSLWRSDILSQRGASKK